MARIASAFCLVLASCLLRGEPCVLTETVLRLAGSEATDCGTIPEDADGTEAWNCALEAFETGVPFHIRWSDTGIDSSWDSVMVFDGQTVWTLRQETWPSTAGPIDGNECVSPYASTQADDPYDPDDVSGFPILTCESLLPAGNHYQVCGEICESCGDPAPLPFPG